MTNIKKTFREKADEILNQGKTRASHVFELTIAFLVVLVCILWVVEISPSTSPETRERMFFFENLIVYIFVVEYLVRWWTKKFSIPFLFTPMALIDLIAIIPTFLPFPTWTFIRVLRLLRILRLLRFLRGTQYFPFEIKEYHLRLTRILFILFALIFISSGIIFDIEHAHNPQNFASFFDALYFTVVALPTVGFGDIVPISFEGKLATLAMILSGVTLIPWQLTSLARYLIIAANKKEEVKCSKCGLQFHDPDAVYCKKCGQLLYGGGEGELDQKIR